MKTETEYAILFKDGWISCRNFRMADKMFKKLTKAIMMLSFDLNTHQSIVFRTRHLTQ